MRSPYLLLLLLTTGCATFAEFEPYYPNWNPPTLSALSTTSEVGNIGGGTLIIEGSGFGDDPDQIVVIFGDDNATIVSISDSEIEVTVPQGPISGGAVDVRVATATGTTTLPGAYTYDVGSTFDSQVGHVQVNNYWESCYGGLSGRLGDEWGVNFGCEDFAYVGYTGISGKAELLGFRYPRLHAENIGYFGGTDQGRSDWVVERPGQLGYVSGVEDLHEELGEVVLRNDVWEGDAYCPDLDVVATYRYGGGTEGALAPVSVYTDDAIGGSACDVGEEGAYSLEELRFCTSTAADGTSDYVYEADWPVPKNFFAGKKNDWTVPPDITFTATAVGIEDAELSLPEPLVLTANEGFEPVLTGEETAGNVWSLSAFQGCFDDAGRGETLDDVALSFTWTRASTTKDDEADKECAEPGEVCAQSTYVRVTLTALSLNWFGTTDYPVRATIVVPDGDRGEDTATIEVPASVLYQFPTVELPQSGGLGGATLLDPNVTNYGYVVVTAERVTDYAVLTESGETVVFSYTTGDFGFFGWENPTEADGCHNCLDDDGDGWTDALDAECAGGSEENGLSDDICNDGVDNDGDGLEDADDPDCESGEGTDESNCSNGEDDDGDGLEDEDDPDCALLGGEGSCVDGLDGDGDGWADIEDPDCLAGDIELGFGTAACNDGEDNDEDGLVDVFDLECETADDDDETGTTGTTGCLDEADGDGDGWTDAADPDCATGTEEAGYGTTACNDGEDDDGDGAIDAADTDCADASDDDEAAASTATGCTDGTDEDADGWIDADDPDCATGDDELGIGATACNDGVDNDADGGSDADDPECADASDDDEAL